MPSFFYNWLVFFKIIIFCFAINYTDQFIEMDIIKLFAPGLFSILLHQ